MASLQVYSASFQVTHSSGKRGEKTHLLSDHPESSRSVPECTATAETVMEKRLRDLLLDMEDRIHQGTLGSLKVRSNPSC